MTHDGSAATSAITIKPFSAPHPACIRTANVLAPPPRMTLKSIPASASSLHAFRSPSPDSPMTTLVPISRRKIAPLPNRVPSRPPYTFDRKFSQNSTSSASLIPSSRSSSLGSEAFMQDTRLIHNESNSSSTVTTPETSSSPLSHLT